MNFLKPIFTRQFSRRLVGFGTWIVLASVLGAWGLLYWGDDWWLATLVMFSPRWVWLLLPIFATLSSAFVRRRSLVPALLSLGVAIGPVMGLCVPWRSVVQDRPAAGIRILTCNMHWRKVDPAALDALILQIQPDLVALQEYRESSPSTVLAGNAWFIESIPGLYLASRHPIRRAEQIGDNSTGPHGSAALYELDTPSGSLTLFSLHLATPRDSLGKIANEDPLAQQGIETNSQVRKDQSDFIASKANRVSAPLLVVGDFNTPPESVLFRTIWNGYEDAFSEAGFGWGYTFANRWTRVRIDHILIGGSGHATRCWVGPDIGSPHRPVIADVTWPGSIQTDAPLRDP